MPTPTTYTFFGELMFPALVLATVYFTREATLRVCPKITRCRELGALLTLTVGKKKVGNNIFMRSS